MSADEPDIGICEPEWDNFPCAAPIAAVAHRGVLADEGVKAQQKTAEQYRREGKIFAVVFCSLVWAGIIGVVLILIGVL